NLVDLLRFCDELEVACNLHVLEGPAHLRPDVLPARLRAEAARRLRAYAPEPTGAPSAQANRRAAERIAHHLEIIVESPAVDTQRQVFATFTRKLDESRGQSLVRAIPELADLIS